MKLRCLLLLVFTFIVTFANSQETFYDKQWRRVYLFELRNLPKSALGVADTIYAKAKREKNREQFIKALLYQSKFALTLEEDAELLIVQRFKKEIQQSSVPQKNILEAILASIYWQYFQQNRWKYHQRSNTAEIVNREDFRTWSSQAIFKEIHRHFQNALTDGATLQKVKLESIGEILLEAENSRMYRPTLFDFLAYMAIDFYETDEHSLPKTSTRFILNDTSHFHPFENTTLPSEDSLSLQLYALRLYQQILTFHNSTKDTTAYIDAELQRLSFLVDAGSYENGTELYLRALKKISLEFRRHPASTLADFEIASTLVRDGSEFKPNDNHTFKFQFLKSLAVEYCDKAIAAFPKSHGAEKCNILKSKILDATVHLTAEEFVPIDKPSLISVAYANVRALSFSAYRIDEFFYKDFLSWNDSLKLVNTSKLTLITQWQVNLPDLHDYQNHKTEVNAPPLPGGMYLIIADVTVRRTNSTNKVFAFARLNVTNLALIDTEFEDHKRFQVVDRSTGVPVSGADIHVTNDDSYNADHIDQHFITDKNGFVKVEKSRSYFGNVTTSITSGTDQVLLSGYNYFSRYYPPKEEEEGYTAKAFLFTDRSIYRPGQTVFFKGILLKEWKKKVSIVTAEWVEVFLDDANGQEVASIRLRTNAYGSFAGEFKLPSGGLTGEYTLYVDEDYEEDSKFYDDLEDFEDGEISIAVEEYKRPTFEATFNPVKETFRPNDKVTVKGSAVAFNGSKISDGKVSYRVVRTSHYPYWNWRYGYANSNEEEIAEGDTITNHNGEFEISFDAIPSDEAKEDQMPVFHYTVSVDVTDINGETHAASTVVKVAYHTLQISITGSGSATRKIPEALTITSQNVNGQDIQSQGSISIFKLQAPATTLRSRPWEAPDLPLMTEEEFRKLFPHDAYKDEWDVKHWKKGKQVLKTSFNTEKSKEVRFTADAGWETGVYIAELTTTDPSGKPVTVDYLFNVLSTGKKDVGDNKLMIVESAKYLYAPGEVMRLQVGSASEDFTMMIDIESEKEIIKTHIEHFSSNTKEILIPVTEKMRNGFVIHCSAVHHNAFLHQRRIVGVLQPESKIEIETITFKDKLQPGAKETWSFEIKGKDAEKQEAEVLASMYDASLDQFKPHEWSFNPRPETYYHSNCDPRAYQSFRNADFQIRNNFQSYYYMPKQSYDALDWFGFSITNNYSIQRDYTSRLYYSVNMDAPSKVMMVRNRKQPAGYMSGVITTSDGSPLPGVNILVKGTDRGTMTDADGRYTLQASAGDTLIYSFVGYNTAEAVVGKKNVIDVIMQEDVAALMEVVVIGYGEQKKSYLTGSVAAVGVSFSESDVVFGLLQGKVAGVSISEKPDGNAVIRLRGSATAAGTFPLYVVDGVVVDSYDVDKDQVAGIEMLKGSAATALYGSRASGGVVIITTKAGQKKLDEEMAKVTARKNFNETAFFFPQLRTNDGRIRFTFTMPESVTRWKLQLLAHTKDLLVGNKILQAVTQKDLMVTPNAPRFLRIGDKIVFSTKITNLTAQAREGHIALQLTDAITGQAIDAPLGNTIRNQTFRLQAKGNTEVSWELKIPPGIDAVQYKVVAKTGKFSDGEQNVLPVLSNRMLVTESIPMSVRSSQTKTFKLEKLASNTSATLQHHQLTLEVTSNPAWYAIQSLPYLMEFPHECAEQLFSRYYANTLSHHVAKSNPKIKEVFEQWKSSGALISNLEKNPELKSMIISETPWLRDAQSEKEQKNRIAMLFDAEQVSSQLKTTIYKLQDMQFGNGGFPWFKGNRYPSRYITQHIACGIGHLRRLNVVSWERDTDIRRLGLKAITFLDSAINEDYHRLLMRASETRAKARTAQDGERDAKAYLDENHTSKEAIQYLYMKSFYADSAVSRKLKPAIDYYTQQSARYWKDYNLYTQAMIALVQYRSSNKAVATEILHSLKENAVVSDEMGMYWKENKTGWYWDEAPVETQALLIEAFSEIESSNSNLTLAERTKCVDDMRMWLLKNKQATQWKTTKATTEAIYALMIKGTDWLSVEKSVDIAMNGTKITPPNTPEAGTGYFKKTWSASEVAPALSEVSLSKKGEGIAWGAMYWQYFEDLTNITGAATPLQLTKKVFIVSNTDQGELLTEINQGTSVKVGNRIRVRIELKTDRPMEFIHMKDMRASGLEPIDVLSEYKWQGGLGYYQSTKDASTNFFFDYIPQGVYVFEYDLRANNKGVFSNGITTIESMYAPEFRSHSEGVQITIE